MDLNFKHSPARPRCAHRPLHAGLALACAFATACHARAPLPNSSPASVDGVAPSPATTPRLVLEREVYLMGTRLRATVAAADAGQGIAGTEAAFHEIRRLEDLLSSWRDDSELGRLNASPTGVPFHLSAELSQLLGEIRPWVEWSGGAFDPGVGPLIDVWDLRGVGRWASAAELERAREISGLDAFEWFESEGMVVKRRPGVWISSGAFGKGAALRAAAGALGVAGISDALLDFGGQIVALGAPPGEDAWVVEVAHPSRRRLSVATLGLTGVSVATSGSSEQFVDVGGQRLGHIIDPRNGRPVPSWGSVTVVADDPLTADVAATALFVLGPVEGFAVVERRDDLGVLVLAIEEERVDARWNGRMAAYLRALAGDPIGSGTRHAVVRIETGDSVPIEVLGR